MMNSCLLSFIPRGYICRCYKGNQPRPLPQLMPRLALPRLQRRNPSPSAVRCAQVFGHEPPTKDKWILHVEDHFSKHPYLYPLKSNQTKEVADNISLFIGARPFGLSLLYLLFWAFPVVCISLRDEGHLNRKSINQSCIWTSKDSSVR